MPEPIRLRIPSGVPGLDRVLDGGLLPGRAYLLRGGPGSGKTTLGLQFLTAQGNGKNGRLFITLGEPEAQIRENAALLGVELDAVRFLDLTPSAELFSEGEGYDIFPASEVEGKPTSERIVAAVDEVEPELVFVDSMTQFRHLASDAYQFRKQVLSFLRFVLDRGATVVLTSEETSDEDLQFMVDGVLDLGVTEIGRVLEVQKFRGSSFRSGRHPIRLTGEGAVVFPRLIPENFGRPVSQDTISSGVPELDQLLGGGLERGTVTLFTGPSGVGKTTVGMQFMKEAAGRGERSVIYLFEESEEVLVGRAEGINIPIRQMKEHGSLIIDPVESLIYSPDEFAERVRAEVEERNVKIVMLDSVAGYRLSLRGSDLALHLHALCKYLGNMGVTTIITNEVERITGEFRATEVGLSFLADNIVFLRYFESQGELRKAIGVLKKRLSGFEKGLRSLDITPYGLKIGAPLSGLRGILSGSPETVAAPPDAQHLRNP